MVPLMECKGTGDLFALSDHLMMETSAFTHSMNLFSSTESGGRFLFSQEPLEWGGRYWVVTDAPLTPPLRVTEFIEWHRRGSLAQWHVYEVELPSTFSASKFNTIKETLTEFFSRKIRVRHPRAYIVHPSPHHLGADGAYVYPHTTEVLYVRRTSKHEISVEGPSDLIAHTAVSSLADDWIQIKGIKPSHQDIVILINGIEQAVIRFDECDLIQPGRLHAYSEELSWDLLHDTPLPKEELFSEEIRIKCGSDRLAQYVAKTNKDWVLEGSVVTLPKNTDKTLSLGGFGEIRAKCSSIEVEHKNEDFSQSQNMQLPMATWIDSIIRARYGPQTTALVRDFISNPSQSNLHKLGPILNSPLMAYIRTAAEHQQPK